MNIKKNVILLSLFSALTLGVSFGLTSKGYENAEALDYEIEIADWEDWKDGVVTFSFDDAGNEYNSHLKAVQELDKYDFKATFNVVCDWMSDTLWNKYKDFAANGHEIGSHSVSHYWDSGEYVTSKQTIENYIKKPCLTLAYVNGIKHEHASDYYIACRTSSNTSSEPDYIISKNGPNDWYTLPALIVGSTGLNSYDSLIGKIGEAVNEKGWVIFIAHGLYGITGNGAFSPLNQQAFIDTLDWCSKNDIWVTSTANATMYTKERNNCIYELVENTGESLTYSFALNDSLSTDKLCKYDYPLSLRANIPSSWNGAKVTQDGDEVSSYVKDGYVYFKGVPNGKNIVISKAKITATSIELKDSISLKLGETEQLSALVTPNNAEDEIIWTSSKPEIVSVNSTGLVTALKIGKTTITVSADNVSANCEVTVYEVPGEKSDGIREKSDGISGGTVAGIIIGSIAAVTAIGVLVWFIAKKKRS